MTQLEFLERGKFGLKVIFWDEFCHCNQGPKRKSLGLGVGQYGKWKGVNKEIESGCSKGMVFCFLQSGLIMGQSTKAVLAVLSFVSAFFAFFSWYDPVPLGDNVWVVRLFSPLFLILFVWAFLRLHLRKDLAPDYLNGMNQEYFNKDGFCFAFAIDGEEGVCRIHAVFQNQFEGTCVGRIAIRPAKEFFFEKPDIATVNFRIECGPGEFGAVSRRIPLLQQYQGKKIKFELGAKTEFPNGKGRRLRFKDGIYLREDDLFCVGPWAVIKFFGLFYGHLRLGAPQTIELDLPSTVSEDPQVDMEQEANSFWKCGEPLISDPACITLG